MILFELNIYSITIAVLFLANFFIAGYYLSSENKAGFLQIITTIWLCMFGVITSIFTHYFFDLSKRFLQKKEQV